MRTQELEILKVKVSTRNFGESTKMLESIDLSMCSSIFDIRSVSIYGSVPRNDNVLDQAHYDGVALLFSHSSLKPSNRKKEGADTAQGFPYFGDTFGPVLEWIT